MHGTKTRTGLFGGILGLKSGRKSYTSFLSFVSHLVLKVCLGTGSFYFFLGSVTVYLFLTLLSRDRVYGILFMTLRMSLPEV